MWLKLKAGEIEIATGELTILESLVAPIKNSNTILIDAYNQLFLSSEVQLIPITQPVLRTAAHLRATTNIKTPDAIHAATALAQNCSIFNE